jgi:putative hydrolase of the HAD superfamily
MSAGPNGERQHLIIDADDTLWENNIYFERAFDAFVEFLNHSSLSKDEIQDVLDEIELANNKIHGYGSLNFARNMHECYERLVEREIQPDAAATIMGFAEGIMNHPVQLMDGVEQTLQELAMRHDLVLFTKGHPEEQKLKVDRSGVGVYFGRTEIVREKDEPAYRKLIADCNFDATRSWMIGNSPKSDINPALQAGLNAVFVPHERTWHLERTDLRSGAGKLLVIERFSDLLQHF